jgi:hypothetical protein
LESLFKTGKVVLASEISCVINDMKMRRQTVNKTITEAECAWAKERKMWSAFLKICLKLYVG